ncbi:hypothetical protein EDD85DRAFT_798743 [Armillaria nabsnona]|nr:hypothetical protein EDD85DRAFT_798743 [Armillaria nabsnona]
MISSLEMNLAMCRAFTNIYQKRERKVETSAYEGETVKNQVSSRTNSHLSNSGDGKKSLFTKRKGNPPLTDRLPQKLVIDTVGTKKFWQRFATLPQPSGWDCKHIVYRSYAYTCLSGFAV